MRMTVMFATIQGSDELLLLFNKQQGKQQPEVMFAAIHGSDDKLFLLVSSRANITPKNNKSVDTFLWLTQQRNNSS
jgi:hypothetical protein